MAQAQLKDVDIGRRFVVDGFCFTQLGEAIDGGTRTGSRRGNMEVTVLYSLAAVMVGTFFTWLAAMRG